MSGDTVAQDRCLLEQLSRSWYVTFGDVKLRETHEYVRVSVARGLLAEVGTVLYIRCEVLAYEQHREGCVVGMSAVDCCLVGRLGSGGVILSLEE